MHNGIEYELMQTNAGSSDILRNRGSTDLPGGRFTLSMPDITEAWRHGSGISSWLPHLAAAALVTHPQLKDFLAAPDWARATH